MERIKCFICGSWVMKQYCVAQNFYGNPEDVCPGCYQKMLERDSTDKESHQLLEGMREERTKEPDKG